MEVSTSRFEFDHGRKPRGFGMWAFFFEGETEPRWFSGTFGEAKKMAVAEARRHGVSRMRVGS